VRGLGFGERGEGGGAWEGGRGGFNDNGIGRQNSNSVWQTINDL
jgi:hypothetical protein